MVALAVSVFLPQFQSYMFQPRGSIGEGDEISIEGRSVELHGTAANIAADHKVWLLVKPLDDLKHYAVPVKIMEGDWESGPIALGEDRVTAGAEFLVYL
jgi:hypothetical protein